MASQGANETKAWLGFALPIIATIYLYANLFIMLNTPFLLGGDQTYFWTRAQRMQFGEVPYRDFFQFTPPGTDVFYLALFKWLGPNIWVTNLAVLALGIALCWVGFRIALQIMSPEASFLSVLLFLVLVYGKLLNATHHWFSILILLCAIRIGMDQMDSLRVWIVGMLLGVASFFTHTHALVGFFAFVLLFAFQRWRDGLTFRFLFQRLTLLIFGLSAAWFICNLYFIETVGLKQLWYYEVTFVGRYVPRMGQGAFLGLPEVPTLRRAPFVGQYLIVYVLVAVTYPLSLWQCWIRRHDRGWFKWEKIVLLSLTGFLLAVEVAFSLNWLRVFAVSMPAILLATFWIDERDWPGRYTKRMVWACVLILAFFQTWSKHRSKYIVSKFPAGRAALPIVANEKFVWVMQHTRPGEFFFEMPVPSMYLPLGLRSPVFVEGLGTSTQTRPEFVQRTIRELNANSVRYVLWSHHLGQPQVNQMPVDPLAQFRAFLLNQYRCVWTFSDQDEIWERR